MRTSFFRSASVVLAAALAIALQAACARSVDTDTDTDPSLVAPSASNPAPLAACVSTDCPMPWATCQSGGDGLCATDTSNDPNNCGACGKECPHPTGALHATSLCSDGKCVYACEEFNADCNHQSYDGCEVYTADDPKNCGGCGLACKDGEVCWKGACGCPTGFTLCDGECRNLDADDLACGACGKKCVPPPWTDPEWKCGPGVQPTNTGWGCTAGGCKMDCSAFTGDCNGDICADGCETDLKTDNQNCGACGRACAANQECVDGQCLCPAGATRCGNRCVDLDVDPDNCGKCGNGCDGSADADGNGTPTCTGGRCGFACKRGYEDCNKRDVDGCEINTSTDPRNCGSCGSQCAKGQPCVLGKCLTKPCDPTKVTK